MNSKYEPAFPYAFENDDCGGFAPGMSLRDYIAAGVLNSLTAGERPDRLECEEQEYAERAYKLADAMLAERAKANTSDDQRAQRE